MAHSSLIITNYSNFAGHSPGFQTSFPLFSLSLSLRLSRNLRIIHFSFLADSSFETRDCPSLSPFEYLFHRKLKVAWVILLVSLFFFFLSFSLIPSLFFVFFPPEMWNRPSIFIRIPFSSKVQIAQVPSFFLPIRNPVSPLIFDFSLSEIFLKSNYPSLFSLVSKFLFHFSTRNTHRPSISIPSET